MTQTAKLRGDVLILTQAILLPATCIITYIIATSLDHVETRFPYISDSGTWPPESCIFGFLLCLYSLCTLIAAYGRWRMVRAYDHESRWRRFNNVALAAGYTAALGVLIVATFQETSVLSVHLLGAALAFGFANLYMWLHSFISRGIPNVPSFIPWLIMLRFGIAFLTTITAILVPAFSIVAQIRYDGNESKTHDPGTGKWESDMNGYEMHVAASSLEWTLAFFVSIFFLTYVREFRHVYFGMPLINFNATQISNREADNDQRGGVDGPQLAYPDLDQVPS